MAVVSERPITSILGEMADHVERIVRAELMLATVRLRDEMRRFERASLLLAVGLAVAALAAVFVLLAIVFALATVMSLPLAALLVGVVTAAVALACLAAGWNQIVGAISHTKDTITGSVAHAKHTIAGTVTEAKDTIEGSLPWKRTPVQ